MTSIAASRTRRAEAARLYVDRRRLSIGCRAQIGEAAAQPKKILFLHSFGPNFEQGATWSREIQKELNRQSPWPLDIQEQSLVTALEWRRRLPRPNLWNISGRSMPNEPPDLIVALGAPAARFVQQHRADLYPTTPMLLAAVEVRRVEPSMLSEHDAVVGVRLRSGGCCRKHSAAVAGDEDHRDHHRKLPQRAILGWRASTDTGPAAEEQG